MALVAVAPMKMVRGVASPDFKGKTYDWRASDTAQNSARVRAVFQRFQLAKALEKSYSTDAHLVTYTVSLSDDPLQFQPRLRKNGLPWTLAQGYTVECDVLFCDCDNPDHSPWTPDLEREAAAQWRDLAPLQTCGVYHTAHGRRFIQPLDEAVPVEYAERCLQTWLGQLSAAGLEVDWSCRDWTRLYRLPHVMRGGQPYRSPLVDLSRMSPQPIAPAPASPTSTAPRKRPERRPVPALRATLPPEWRNLAHALARPLRGGFHGERHGIALRLAGALLHREVPPEVVPAIATEIVAIAGWDPDHGQRLAGDTVARWAAGDPVAHDLPPVLQSALDAALQPPVVESVADATRRLENAIRNARGVTVIRAQCGLGKTRAARLVALERAARSGARQNTRTAISVPTNDLAIQVTSDLRAAGADVLRVFGPSGLRLADGGWACHYREAAAHLAHGGQSIRWELCHGRNTDPCPRLAQCPAAAGGEGPKDARITVGPHGLLAQLDRAVGTTGLLVIDEPPAPIEEVLITQDDLRATDSQLPSFLPRYAACMAPALRAITAWLPTAPLGETGSLSVALTPDREDVEDLDRAHSYSGALDALGAAQCALEEGQTHPPLERVARYRSAPLTMRRIADASRILHAIYRGLTDPAVTATVCQPIAGPRQLAITGVAPQLAQAIRRDGSCVIMAADADLYRSAYETTLGCAVEYVEARAGDGAPITRVLLETRSATRRRWIVQGRHPTGLLRQALALVEDRYQKVAQCVDSGYTVGVRPSVLVVTFKGLCDWLRQQLVSLPHVHVGHYGALRGLDRYSDADAVITLGDPIPNLDHVSRTTPETEASSDRADALARAELEQAHGRLRTVHRRRPAVAIHVGRILPGGWAEGVEVLRAENAGRPPREATSSLREMIDRIGGASYVARTIGVNRSTVARWRRGEMHPPAGTVATLVGLANASMRKNETMCCVN